jgi:hypothetical protein
MGLMGWFIGPMTPYCFHAASSALYCSVSKYKTTASFSSANLDLWK